MATDARFIRSVVVVVTFPHIDRRPAKGDFQLQPYRRYVIVSNEMCF